MKDLLGPEGAGVLERLAGGPLLVGLDFDGTLAPIVDDRDAARMRPRTAELVRAVAARFVCVVVSGRGQADVAARLEGAPVARVVGNHGVDEGSAEAALAARFTAEARASLARALRDVPGIDLEDKRLSLSVHYRLAADKPRARAAALAAVASLGDAARLVDGKDVLNVLPAGGAHKGTALAAARADLAPDANVLFVGDDVTDEDAFALPSAPWLVGVRVGHAAGSAAAYVLADQTRIDELLARLVAARG